MLSNRPRPEDFPDSPYARELLSGAVSLRFVAPLEDEYIASHLHRVHRRLRAWFSLAALLSIAFTIGEIRSGGLWSMASLAHVTVLIPCAFTLFWLTWSKQYERYYMPAARILVTLFNALIATFIAQALAKGEYEELAGLTVNLFAIFFFTGLMFRQALLTSAIALLSFVVTAYAVGLENVVFLKSMVAVSLTTFIAAFIYRDVEQAYRTSFLEGALLAELVARDSVTGLMNRRAFDEHLRRVWQHALRDQRAIAVLMIDIDHFKQYNDSFGHQAGDVALRSVAGVIHDFARRPLDLAARYGGEEFVVILYDLAPAHVQDAAERLRECVQQLKQAADSAMGAEVTVSVGVGVAVPSIGRTAQGIIQLADEALYEAKRAGRNRVVLKGLQAYLTLETGAFQTPQDSRRQH
jgi:diguanylate cyclase (GGDEF)-like protein